MVEPVTGAALLAKWGPVLAEGAAKAIVGELTKSLFFGSDKKKLKKALEEISKQLVIINKKLDAVYDLAQDIRRSIEELKGIVEGIPGISNTQNAHVTFATNVGISLLDLSSEIGDETINPDTTFLKLSFRNFREARGNYLAHRMDLQSAIHSSALDILYFFYSDLQITLGFVQAIWGDGTDSEKNTRKYLSDFVASYEPVLMAISNSSGSGSLDLHLDQVVGRIALIAKSIRPHEPRTVLTSHRAEKGFSEMSSKGEPTVFAWWSIHSVTVAFKSIDVTILGERSLVGVDSLQFVHTETRTVETFDVPVKTRFRVVEQASLNAGSNAYAPTSLSEPEVQVLLGMEGAVTTVTTPGIQLSATEEFLLNVDKYNRESTMAATLEELKEKVRAALELIQNDNFRQNSLIPQLRSPL